MHTPGHTPEHISFILTDTINSDKPLIIFSGDFIFVGDIGRPDLLEKAAGITGTMEAGAKQMFKSLRKFKTLPDYIQVWPGHGAGSACGKSLGAVPSSTVGYEKIVNWALNINDEDEFIARLLDGQPEPPKYFSMMKKLNKRGPGVIGKINIPKKLSAEQFKEANDKGYTIIDTRNNLSFAKEHIDGTINIEDNNSFSNWAGWILNYYLPFVIISSDNRIEEVNKKLIRIGFDNILGYANGINDLKEYGFETSSINLLSTEEMKNKINNSFLIDFRNKSEYLEGFIPGAQHIFTGYIANMLDKIPRDKDIVVYCASGERSSIASSILLKAGFNKIYNYASGIIGWKKAKLELAKNKRF